MEIVFAFLAGLLTLINPCVLPVLPVVLGSALQASPRGPLALAAGMSFAFVVLGLFVTAFGYVVGLSGDRMTQIGAIAMIAFGAVLLYPGLRERFSRATAGVSAQADRRSPGEGPAGQFWGGALLGAAWSPCIGPTLGGALALASTGRELGHVTVILSAFAAGVATLVLLIGYGAQGWLLRHRAAMRMLSLVARPVLGGIFMLVGLAILLGLHHLVEAWIIGHMPAWLTALSVRY